LGGYEFALKGAALTALPLGGLWWESRRTLCVSDLHLGKAERIARLGGALLPPFDTRETLMRLQSLIEAHDPWTVICLGDSFDDAIAEGALGEADNRALLQMIAGRRWIWIAGNHDPGPVEMGGTWVAEHVTDGLTFRHIAEHGAQGEISGHFHPKARVPGARARPCFMIDEHRAILPAFGAYTGGLHVGDPSLAQLFEKPVALLTGRQIIPMPA